MEIKRPEPGEEPEQITLDVKDENSGTTISIDTVISPRKMTYEETMSCFDRAYDELLDILQKDNATGLVTVLIFAIFCPRGMPQKIQLAPACRTPVPPSGECRHFPR